VEAKMTDLPEVSGKDKAVITAGNGKQFTFKELTEFNNIVAKAPIYTKDEMTLHENPNGHMADLLPTGFFNADSGGGGQTIIEAAEDIIKNKGTKKQPNRNK
jgi:hypothetical protein